MVMFSQIAILALVGTALALPLAHRGDDSWEGYNDGHQSQNIPSNVENIPTQVSNVVITTETITIGGGNGHRHHGHHHTATDSAPQATPSPSTGSSSNDNDDDDDSGSGSTEPAAGSGTGYMAVVSKYRAAGGLSALTQNSQLEANALKTAADGNGRMEHQLNSGTMAQVLAPGQPDDFEKVYVGGWLCETPSLKGLNGICGTMSDGWIHTSHGHADILTSTSYSKIGCANSGGIWSCDLA